MLEVAEGDLQRAIHDVVSTLHEMPFGIPIASRWEGGMATARQLEADAFDLSSTVEWAVDHQYAIRMVMRDHVANTMWTAHVMALLAVIEALPVTASRYPQLEDGIHDRAGQGEDADG